MTEVDLYHDREEKSLILKAFNIKCHINLMEFSTLLKYMNLPKLILTFGIICQLFGIILLFKPYLTGIYLFMGLNMILASVLCVISPHMWLSIINVVLILWSLPIWFRMESAEPELRSELFGILLTSAVIWTYERRTLMQKKSTP